nr:3-keto-5-aminohexanoate cleavage protein [Bradyrhizobium sp.]
MSASELACDAVAVRAAGAEELHIHVRAEDGAETLEPSALAKTIQAIRRAVPGMPIGVGTGAWIMPGGRRRHRHIRDWTEKPDYASVNLGEADAPEVIDLLTIGGIDVEAGLWNSQDAERFVAEIDFKKCLRVLVEMTSGNGEEALREAHQVFSILRRADCALPVLLHGEAGSVWPCVREAWRLDLSTRIGFEDGVHLPNGAVAANNADLVRAAIQLRG